MTPFSLELGAIVVCIATQLITYGALRQQVKNLEDEMREQKLERKQLDERVRALEITSGFPFATRKSGG
jgi:wobble nucleotide-excising tRNase